jgi:sugar phosphate permease
MDYFPKKQHYIPITLISASIPLGAAMGYILGGVLEQSIGWKSTFLYVGFVGFCVALFGFFFKDARPTRDGNNKLNWSQLKKDVSILWKNPTYKQFVFGYTAFTFVVGALASWMPHYLTATRDIEPSKANILFGAITAGTGTVGTLLGGWIFEKLDHTPAFFKFNIGVGLVFCMLCFYIEDNNLFLLVLGISELLLFATQAPVNLRIIQCVPAHLRSTAAAMCVFIIHLLGDLISPAIVGFIADITNLEFALKILPAVLLLAYGLYTKDHPQHQMAKSL